MVKKINNELGDFDSIVPDEYHEDHFQTDYETNKTLNDVEPLCQTDVSHLIKHPRRRIKSHLGSCCLSAFMRSGNGKTPKKEYVRCKLIRGHKRALRQIKSGLIPSTTINKIDPTNAVEMEKWAELRADYQLSEENLSEIARTEQGPATDGVAKRAKSTDDKKPERSFNNEYCRNYFGSIGVRRSFGIYCEVLFASGDLKMLGKKFQLDCCASKNHTELCKQKWEDFKVYLHTNMILELEAGQGDIEDQEDCDEDNIAEELSILA